MANCYHYDLNATGTCPKCGTAVTVAERVSTSIGIGYDDGPRLTGRIITPTRPTAREALAIAIGCAIEAITVDDVVITEAYAKTGMTVMFRMTGSKAVLQAVLDSSDTVTKTPDRVEYEA